jgi:hypothetical protein
VGRRERRWSVFRRRPDLSLKVMGLAVFTVLQGCIYLPRTTQVFDPECQIVANHMVLQQVQVAAIQGCTNEGCVALIVGAGIATGASAVISGTIVVAGNVAYWFERRAKCQQIRQR